MATRRVQLQHLIGTKVCDASGRFAGRIEEVRATNSPTEGCCVSEYMLGRQGLIARLSIADASMLVLRFLGATRPATGRRVPWQQLDFSDPKHPRLRCTVAEL